MEKLRPKEIIQSCNQKAQGHPDRFLGGRVFLAPTRFSGWLDVPITKKTRPAVSLHHKSTYIKAYGRGMKPHFSEEGEGMKLNGDMRASVVDQVVAMELEMFMAVPTSEPSACQEHPEVFKVMRWMTHSVLSEEILQSYLDDLEAARAKGRNLMTEKYARMENKIPKSNKNERIDEIVGIEMEWIGSLKKKYPLTFKGGNPGFRNYLSSELETYSDKTLRLYHEAVTEARREGRNLAEERYDNLFRRLGYGSVGGREKAARSSSV
jgi:hypothetical protein